MTTLPPIACTLTSGDYADRLTWIAKLNRESLRSYHLEDLTLELVYDPMVGSQVRDLVEREEKCCAFLHFTVNETADAIHMRIEAPPDARYSARALFMPFLEGAPGVIGANRIAGTAAVTSATAAVACAVCCVLPFAFPAVALTGVGAMFAVFSHVYRWALYAAIVTVALGWALVGRQSKRSKTWPAPATLRVMAAATILLGVALSWPFMEPRVIAIVTVMVRS